MESMSESPARDSDKLLEFEAISPEEIRKRARSAQSSGLTSSLLTRSISVDSKLATPGQDSSLASAARQSRRSLQEPSGYASSLAALNELEEVSGAEPGEDRSSEEVCSPGSRPILRKARAKKRENMPDSELGRSLQEDGFVPPHILSLPTENFEAPDFASRPGSLYEGAGRKLRGMDAVRFRRHVMRQTGFLESTSENIVH